MANSHSQTVTGRKPFHCILFYIIQYAIPIEDQLPVFFANTFSGIVHPQQEVTIFSQYSDTNNTSLRGIFKSIGNQVIQYLRQTSEIRIPVNGFIDLHLKRYFVLFRQFGEGNWKIIQHFVDIHLLDITCFMSRLHPSKFDNFLYQRIQTFCIRFDKPDILPGKWICIRMCQNSFTGSVNQSQWCTELMGDVSKES